jgi:hypothetical protein
MFVRLHCFEISFDGYMAEFHFIDGTALDPSSFGEFDDNGVWRPIAYTGSYGTNGFYLNFRPQCHQRHRSRPQRQRQ